MVKKISDAELEAQFEHLEKHLTSIGREYRENVEDLVQTVTQLVDSMIEDLEEKKTPTPDPKVYKVELRGEIKSRKELDPVVLEKFLKESFEAVSIDLRIRTIK